MTSIGITLPGPQGAAKTYTSSNFVMPMLIDTGSTLSYIREDVVSAVGRQLNATVDSEKTYWVDCKLRQQNGTVDIGFNRGRLVVTISYKDFIWQQTPGKCLMGFQIAEQGSTNYVLGDTFLRGAYCGFFPLRLSWPETDGDGVQWYSISKSTSCGWPTTTTAETACKWSGRSRQTHSMSSGSADPVLSGVSDGDTQGRVSDARARAAYSSLPSPLPLYTRATGL